MFPNINSIYGYALKTVATEANSLAAPFGAIHEPIAQLWIA
jgi:hypothetical protein